MIGSASEGPRSEPAVRRRPSNGVRRARLQRRQLSSRAKRIVCRVAPETLTPFVLRRTSITLFAQARAGAGAEASPLRFKITEVPVERGDELVDPLALCAADRPQHRRRPRPAHSVCGAPRAAGSWRCAPASSSSVRDRRRGAPERSCERLACAAGRASARCRCARGRRRDGPPC